MIVRSGFSALAIILSRKLSRPRPLRTSTAASRSLVRSAGEAWNSWGPTLGGSRGSTVTQSPATALVKAVIGKKVVSTLTGSWPASEPRPRNAQPARTPARRSRARMVRNCRIGGRGTAPDEK